jgi:uncharacterized protein (TIGR00255 family)
VKSVNHRFLDQFYRLPESYRRLESQLRPLVGQKLKRGRVEIFLQMKRHDEQVLNQINTTFLTQFLELSEKVAKEFQIANDIKVSHCLAWPNMFQSTENQDDDFYPAVLESFNDVMHQLIQARQQEGRAIEKMLTDRVEKIQGLVQSIQSQKELQLPALREKLNKKIALITSQMVDSSRLEQELAICMMRLDIAEELDRLNAHLLEIHRVFKEKDAHGRRLDFLIQELHRETNTIGSKTESKVISQMVIDMKVLIEQMREQIQNVE